MTQYRESDPINSRGLVYDAPLDVDGPTRMLLSTNDSITNMWASPTGHLWIGSGWGNVWTTAPVHWAPARSGTLRFKSELPDLDWHVTTLPNNAKDRRPNVTSIWGITDDFVLAADFSGSVYRWSGKTWIEMVTGVGSECNEISGDAPNNVYAVTRGGAILHFDGDSWSRVPIGDGEQTYPVLTGVRVARDRRVYVTQNRGLLFRGDANRFEPVAETRYGLYGVAIHSNMVFLCGMPGGGLRFFEGRGVEQLNDEFQAADVTEIGRHVAFFESDQPERPSFVQYTPSTDEWIRRSF